ncbi:GNAT family N-acetyltransferase [Leptolyngbya sp. 15MV]|nr:GNAT family N-acetyltransferase [Leptolyngbya sp. 15MV]
MMIVDASEAHLAAWGAMRFALWPWDSPAEHAEQAAEFYLRGKPDRAAFIALDPDGNAIGFAEATLRRDYVEGCDTSPVGFLEGIYIMPEARGRGVGRALSEAVADWARAQGCTEYASNALLDNHDSHAFHAAIGFAETERVVYFKRPL